MADITTSAAVDDLGRPKTTTDGKNNVTSYTYVDSFGDSKVTVTPPAGPKVVTDSNSSQGYVQTQTLAAHGEGGAAAPDGTVMSQKRTLVGLDGAKYEADNWYDMGGAAPYKSFYSYDSTKHWSQTADAVGTITRTADDALGRPVSVLVGTSASNLTDVVDNQYDGGNVGDGDLTLVTQHVDASNTRATKKAYDWRDRLVETFTAFGAAGTFPVTYSVLDNLGEVTSLYQFAGGSLSYTNGVPDRPADSAARALTKTGYDPRGRPFQVQVFGPDPTSGLNSSTPVLTSLKFYDGRGHVIAASTPGGPWTKSGFDGAGRPVTQSLTDNAGGSVTSAAGDAVLNSTATTYDPNGNAALVVTGQLTPAGTPRLSYVGNFFDAANRLTASENVGTNGGTPWSRPASPDPADGAHLVTLRGYDGGGFLTTTTDPTGTVTKQFNDALGRPTIVYQNYDNAPGFPFGGNVRDVRTDYQYDGLNHKTLVDVHNVKDGNNVELKTQYLYGTAGPADNGNSAFYSNDVLGQVRYPGYGQSTVLADSEIYGYDLQGEVATHRDRNGTLHGFAYDPAGREQSETLSLPSNQSISNAVTQLSFAYDSAGRPYLFTSNAPGGGVVNQVERLYNGFGQLAIEYQEHSGAVTPGSYKVQYLYDASDSYHLKQLVYPDSRALQYGYTPVGQVSGISDVSAVAGGPTTPVQTYAYMGLGTVVQRSNPQPNLTLTYLNTTPTGDAGDAVTGLDRFGRVVDQEWLSGGTPVDRYKYTFDADSDVLTRDNALSPSLGQTNYYDSLNRPDGFSVGALPVLTPQLAWSTDAAGNRFGGPYPSQASYDSDGKLGGGTEDAATTVNLSNGQSVGLTFDGWDRVTKTAEASGSGTDNPTRGYDYDALGREITLKALDSAGAVASATQFFYDGGRVIEQRDATGRVTEQYVWSPDGALVLRDRDADGNAATGYPGLPNPSGVGLDERVYALSDADGSVTAIAGIGGTVLARFTYDQSGLPTARDAAWNETAGADMTDSGPLPYDWQYLWRGGRWQPMAYSQTFDGFPTQHTFAGMYTMGGSGSSWYDPVAGRAVKPSPLAYQNGLGASQGDWVTDVWNTLDFSGPPSAWAGHNAALLLNKFVAGPANQRGAAAWARGDYGEAFLAMRTAHDAQMVAGLLDPGPGLQQMADNAGTVAGRDGLVAGWAYLQSATSGVGSIGEAVTGRDMVTGKELGGYERMGRGYAGATQVAMAVLPVALPAVGELAALGAAAEEGTVAAADAAEVAADSAAGEVAQAEEEAEVVCENGNTCFTAGTLILTASGTVPIESLRVGRKVLTEWTKDEPRSLDTRHGTAVDPETWRLVRLRMPNPEGGDTIDIELLRPLGWVRRWNCDAFRRVPISMAELSLEGWAEVLSVQPCPPIEAGPGRVVTATVSHINSQVLEVSVGGLERPMEPTRPHRFFSEDRGDWVAAEDLDAGERLRTAGGEPAVVEAVRPKPGVHRVYNVEVEHEHQYFVSRVSVLVHNVYDPFNLSEGMLESVPRPGPGEVVLWKNIHPGDLPQGFVEIHPLEAAMGDGAQEYAYVVLRDGRLRLGAFDELHVNLAEGGPVRSAGMARFVDGGLVEITNESGHYVPYGPGPEAEAEAAFGRELGSDVAAGKYREAIFDRSTLPNQPNWYVAPRQGL